MVLLGMLRTLHAQTTPVTEAVAFVSTGVFRIGAVVIVPVGGNVPMAKRDLVRATTFIRLPGSGKLAPLSSFLSSIPFGLSAGVLVNLGYLAYFYGYYSGR